MTSDNLLDELIERETSVWLALQAGDMDADRRLLSDDFLGVYPSGFSNRDEHAAQLANGPTVSTFQMLDARVIELSESAALLIYRADFVHAATSLWQRRSGEWINVFSQDTPAAT